MTLKRKYQSIAKTFRRKMVFSRDGCSLYLTNPKVRENYKFTYFFTDAEAIVLAEDWRTMGDYDYKLILLVMDYMIESCQEKGLEFLKFSFVDKHLQHSLNHCYSVQEFFKSYGFSFSESVGELIITEDFLPRSPVVEAIEKAVSNKKCYEHRLDWKESNACSFESATSSLITSCAFYYFEIAWDGYEARIGLCFRNGKFIISETKTKKGKYLFEVDDFVLSSDTPASISQYLEQLSASHRMVNLLSPPKYFLQHFVIQNLGRTAETLQLVPRIMESFIDLGYSYEEIEQESGRMFRDYNYFQSKKGVLIDGHSPPVSYQSMEPKWGTFRFRNHYLFYFVGFRGIGKSTNSKFAIFNSEEEAVEQVRPWLEEHCAKFG